jgi:sphingolipid 4-desaturase/C4-monooxygenase
MDHHKYQGVDGVDTDLPTAFEAKLFSSFLGKLFFATFQLFFYALRPVLVRYQPLTVYHLLNVVHIFAIDYLIYANWGLGSLFYLWASTIIAGSGLHPCAAHFIAEHYVFTGDWETYSYYGILNKFCFNVGYHNEHHDFPNIPWTRLPALRKLAAPFYENLPYHESWPLVTYKFVVDPTVAVFNRVKRQGNVRLKMEANVQTEEKEGGVKEE